MYKNITAALIILLILFNCCGCWNLVEVNNTAIVAGLGADVLDNGQMHFSVQVETASAAGEGEPVKPENLVLTSTGRTITEAARKITLIMPRTPLWSHASSLVIGEQLANSDLALVIDFLARNRNVRMDSTMLVAKNARPDQVFAVNDPLTGCSARCLENLLSFEEITRGNYTPVNIAEFLFKLATPGVDPVLPMLTVAPLDSGQALHLQGTAIFRERRMVGVLNEIESRGYRWLYPVKNMGGLLVTQMPQNKEMVAFEPVKFTCKQTPRLQSGKIVMDIEIQALLNFYEQQGTSKLVGMHQRQDLEIAAAREIKQEVRSCINKAQSLNSDILGWGRTVYRHHPAQWEKLQSDWDELYPQIKANIRVSCKVDRTYLSTKSFEFR